MTDTTTSSPEDSIRPIEAHDQSWMFADYSALVRRIRPAYPEAIVFEVDAGMPDEPNVRMRADTRTEEGDITVILAKAWLREQSEFVSGH